MKIDNSTKSVTDIATGDGQKRTDKAAKASPQPSGNHEKVDLSALSSQLQAVEHSMASSGAFDAEKVQEIKNAISQGHFKVNAGVVADRLLETVKQLMQAHGNKLQ